MADHLANSELRAEFATEPSWLAASSEQRERFLEVAQRVGLEELALVSGDARGHRLALRRARYRVRGELSGSFGTWLLIQLCWWLLPKVIRWLVSQRSGTSNLE